MKRIFFTVFALVFFIGCAQNKQAELGQTEFQKEINAEFKDASQSPLKPKELKNFKGLEFFAFDSAYVVKAILKRTPDSKWFKMKTTTERMSNERIFGIVRFELKGKEHQLNVYQGQDLMQTEGFEDYLFLPFLDDTNGEESYGGGRYIDLRIPEDDTIVIDFNTSYNPYCAYNEKYSCPIVPRENYVETEVRAGVKAYKK
ncbi:MAG TPA: DUF1684 domain-containing protein [Aquaticitalea sp.]|nr:DUF1684 domain-containing protein [Aquaticitalea sp.]